MVQTLHPLTSHPLHESTTETTNHTMAATIPAMMKAVVVEEVSDGAQDGRLHWDSPLVGLVGTQSRHKASSSSSYRR